MEERTGAFADLIGVFSVAARRPTEFVEFARGFLDGVDISRYAVVTARLQVYVEVRSIDKRRW